MKGLVTAVFVCATLATATQAIARDSIITKDPVYPPVALRANIGGVVRILVTVKKGSQTPQIKAQSGPQILAESAKKNIATWQFPTENYNQVMVITFKYIPDPNPNVPPTVKFSKSKKVITIQQGRPTWAPILTKPT